MNVSDVYGNRVPEPPRKERGPWRIVRRVLVVLGVCFVLLVGCGLTMLYRQSREIGKHRAAYESIERGMTVEAVVARMPSEGSWEKVEHIYAAWDDDRLPEEEAKRIQSALSFSVPTFFIGITYEITFDAERRVVGRHIYD